MNYLKPITVSLVLFTSLVALAQNPSAVYRETYYALMPFWESPYQPFKGAFPITEKEAAKRIHLKFDHDKKNRIVAVHVKLGDHHKEFEGFFGNLYINAPLTKISYGQNKEVHHFFDRFGDQTVVQGKIYKKVYEKDNHGRNIKLSFWDKEGQVTTDMFGVQNYVWTHNHDGSIIEERLDVDAKIVPLRGEFQLMRTKMFFDEKGYFRTLQNIDEKGNVIDTDKGVAQFHYFYDEQGRFDKWEVYNSSGEKAIGPSNTAGEQNIYHEYNLKNIVFFDAKGNPATHWSGAQMWHFEVDRFGNYVSLTFCDSSGNPMNANGGYAKRKWQWSDDGRFLISESYFDEDGKPMEHLQTGVHKVVYSRNEKGVVTDTKKYDRGNALIHQKE